jgi:hypothetical protein
MPASEFARRGGKPFRRDVPPIVLPKHVRHCYSNGARDWWIFTWNRKEPGKKTRVPYNCESWRCEHCKRQEAAVTFARIKEACTPLDAGGFSYWVLTLDRDGFFSGKPWPDSTTAYRQLGKLAQSFLYRLRRWTVRMGWFTWAMKPAPRRRGGIAWVKVSTLQRAWVSVVESHRSGWPHLNLVIHHQELAEFLEENAPERPGGHSDKCRCRDCREAVLLRGELRELATASGWGVQSTAERARSSEALAGYIVKLAGMADEGVSKFTGEVAKITQRPMTAPERFRRLRSGKGFLPPRRFNPEVTGTLVRRTREPDGTVLVLPLHKVAPEYEPHVVACCYVEEQIAHAELQSDALKEVIGAWAVDRAVAPVSTWRPLVTEAEAPKPIRIEPLKPARPVMTVDTDRLMPLFHSRGPPTPVRVAPAEVEDL